MKAGHTFTIEPMINQGTWEDKTWPDKWTAVNLYIYIYISNFKRLLQMVKDLHNLNIHF